MYRQQYYYRYNCWFDRRCLLRWAAAAAAAAMAAVALNQGWGRHHMATHRNYYRLEEHRTNAGAEIVELICASMHHNKQKRPTLTEFTSNIKAWKTAPKGHNNTVPCNKKQKCA